MVRIAISQAVFDAIARTLDPLRRATTVAGLDKPDGPKRSTLNRERHVLHFVRRRPETE
jgi:hypothetical protein